MSATESEAFTEPRRERTADELGMWIFIGSEALLFGAIVLTFVLARLHHRDAFVAGSKELSLPLGTINTAVLITSSLTMALADAAADSAVWRRARRLLALTAALGFVFLAIKFTEYSEEVAKGFAPILGIPLRYAGPDPLGAALFSDLYFLMTGLHAVHLIGGIGLIAVIALPWNRTAPESRKRRATAAGLYWHFIDVIWVFLYPLLYLINR